MQRNWLGIVVVVMAAELAALCVLVVAWLPGQLGSGTDTAQSSSEVTQADLVELKNEVAKVLFRLERMEQKATGDPKLMAEVKQLAQNIDDIGSQIYDFERANQKNMMRMQKNIMRRLAAINPSGASVIPKDPEKLKAWLKEGGITIDKEKGTLQFQGRIVNPTRPLELIAATAGGPLHETLLETFCRPSALRAGMVALGFKEGDPADYAKGTPATGEKLNIELRWPENTKGTPLEELLWNDRTKEYMKTAEWLFTGSDWDTSFLTGEDLYIPDEARVVVALTDNFGHLAVITCNHADSHNEMIWSINQNKLPENIESEITVIVSKAGSD